MIHRKKIMCFPNGRKKAVTLSYDDGIEQDKELIERLRKYKMKATFNISTGWLAKEGTVYQNGETHRRMTLKQCQEVYTPDVCEVSTHGFTHPFLTTLETAMMMDQIVSDREMLENMFGGIVSGHAYPYGHWNTTLKNVLKLAGIHYARTVTETHRFDLPVDWLELNPTCHHEDERLSELTKQFVEMEPDLYPQMFYLWGHTFEFERNNNWSVIEQFMKEISGREDIWYATNGEIYDYVKAYEGLEWSVDGTKVINPTSQDIWVEIDSKLYVVKPGFQILD